jgi:hypothetical protein
LELPPRPRHYATKDGVVTVLPGGQHVQARLVQVVPVRVTTTTSAPILFSIPSSELRVLNVKQYDTADTLDEVYYPAYPLDVYRDYEVIQTRTTTTTTTIED